MLHELAPQLAGTVKFIFQPAEEAIGGMKVMIEESIMVASNVDLALGVQALSRAALDLLS